ncbi:unnamed protein product [Macrosiphum euphorbiae]|uniref:Uncharacterized protein n=1 Tax=Macrosiphum euphorbiae TaxID=13131 RepID=A0AAV0X5I2_9HEMI|nr:unnamed protein product [Macrosiphum euphorbiae]
MIIHKHLHFFIDVSEGSYQTLNYNKKASKNISKDAAANSADIINIAVADNETDMNNKDKITSQIPEATETEIIKILDVNLESILLKFRHHTFNRGWL